MNIPLVKLGDVCEVRAGANQRAVEDPNGAFPIYGSGGKIGYANAWRCPANTVLVGRKGTLNNPMLIPEPLWNIDTAFGLIASEKVLPAFLHRFCQSVDFEKLVPDSGRPSTTATSIRNLDLPLPPLAEQERIVAHLERTLGAIDAMEAKFREMAETAERHFRATLAESFAALREKCPIQTLAELEDAGRIRLGRGQIISRKDLMATPGDYPVYSSAAVGEGIFGRYGKYMFEDPRITWSIDGGGRFFFRTDAKYSVTNVCGWLKVEDCKLDNLFLYYALYSEWVKKTFDYTHKAHPSVIRKEYDLPIPPLEEQERIANRLQQMRQQTATIAQRAGHAKEICGVYRRAVLSEAFGGGVGDE